MTQGNARHMFPGGNTYKGFFSYYDYILPQEKAERIFILKGGPGVGKSTFMKQIAGGMRDSGSDVEYMHCSSDPDSLDGIVFPQINVALMDGTSPHIVDPKNPGAVDEIINLGEFWNEEGFSQHKAEILKINKEIKGIFERAYRYIQAAYSIYTDNEIIYKQAVNHGKVNVCISSINKKIFEGMDVSCVEGKQRRLFASAITPKGFVNYLNALITTDEVVVLHGKPGTGAERILERVRLAVAERGLYTESYYCALNPYKLEHLIIPELNISITTSNSVHSVDRKAAMEVDLNEYLDGSITGAFKETIRFNEEEFDKLLNRAIDTIRKAKAYHDELESFYIPNMNFSGVEKCKEDMLAKILRYKNKDCSGCR